MKIESFKHDKESNTIEVVFREESNSMYACNPPRPVPDDVFKQVYIVENGVIALKETIKGAHSPSTVVPEKITFP